MKIVEEGEQFYQAKEMDIPWIFICYCNRIGANEIRPTSVNQIFDEVLILELENDAR